MKKIIITTLLIASSMFASNYLKFNQQEISIEKDSSINNIIFYNININSEIENYDNFNSCILEGDSKNNLSKIYCVKKDLQTYYSEIEGKVLPDNKALVFNLIFKLKNLDKEIEKHRK